MEEGEGGGPYVKECFKWNIQKMITLIIGILIGAILSTTGLIIYNKFIDKSNKHGQIPMERPTGMMDGKEFNGEDINQIKGGIQEGNPNKQSKNKEQLDASNAENSNKDKTKKTEKSKEQ